MSSDPSILIFLKLYTPNQHFWNRKWNRGIWGMARMGDLFGIFSKTLHRHVFYIFVYIWDLCYCIKIAWSVTFNMTLILTSLISFTLLLSKSTLLSIFQFVCTEREIEIPFPTIPNTKIQICINIFIVNKHNLFNLKYNLHRATCLNWQSGSFSHYSGSDHIQR